MKIKIPIISIEIRIFAHFAQRLNVRSAKVFEMKRNTCTVDSLADTDGTRSFVHLRQRSA